MRGFGIWLLSLLSAGVATLGTIFLRKINTVAIVNIRRIFDSAEFSQKIRVSQRSPKELVAATRLFEAWDGDEMLCRVGFSVLPEAALPDMVAACGATS